MPEELRDQDQSVDQDTSSETTTEETKEVISYDIPDDVKIDKDRKAKLLSEAKKREYSEHTWKLRLQEEKEQIEFEEQEVERLQQLSISLKENLGDNYKQILDSNKKILSENGYIEDIEDPKIHKVLNKLTSEITELKKQQNLNTVRGKLKGTQGLSTVSGTTTLDRNELVKIIRDTTKSDSERQSASDKMAKINKL